MSKIDDIGKGEEEKVFEKFLKETNSLSLAWDKYWGWVRDNNIHLETICTNDYHEAELEQRWIEYCEKVYKEDPPEEVPIDEEDLVAMDYDYSKEEL